MGLDVFFFDSIVVVCCCFWRGLSINYLFNSLMDVIKDLSVLF